MVDGTHVKAAGFEAEGCAISQAAASALCEQLPSWELPELAARTLQYERRLGLHADDEPQGDIAPAPELGDLAAFAGVRDFPTRVRCAALPFRALEQSLAD